MPDDIDEKTRNAVRDATHLKILGICHFIVAGLSVLGIGLMFLELTMMDAIMHDPHFMNAGKGGPPPAQMFDLMKIMFTTFAALFGVVGVLNVLSGIFLLQKKLRTFSLIIAGLNCIQFPFGTILGVFTFIVLFRPSVSDLYSDQ